MANNPMDGYQDIIPYKWEWHTDWHPSVVTWLDYFSDVFLSYDPWNYNNHWRLSGPHDNSKTDFVLDIYGPSSPWPRSQLDKETGDAMAAWIRANHRPRVLRGFWWKTQWSKTGSVTAYNGHHGLFVDHIHLEFDHVLLPQWAIGK